MPRVSEQDECEGVWYVMCVCVCVYVFVWLCGCVELCECGAACLVPLLTRACVCFLVRWHAWVVGWVLLVHLAT